MNWRIMPKPEPLALRAFIPDKASAIAFSGGAGDSARLILDIYAEKAEEVVELLKLRGQHLIITLITEEQLQRS
jgi:hypothetical protein